MSNDATTARTAPTAHPATTAHPASTAHPATTANPVRSDRRADVAATLEGLRDLLHTTALQIHANPQLAFEEVHAVELLTGILEEHGFAVERGIGDLPTAFQGTLNGARAEEKPLVAAVLLEYDALPVVGHGCGHHIIAGSGLGTALALAPHLAGTGVELRVIGTPAEEHGGGKQLLIDKGIFADVDLAIMMHSVAETATYNPLDASSTAVGRWRVTFTGRAAHAAANPADGINANDAALIAQTAAGLLRQRMKDGQRMAMVPRNADEDPVTNIIPECARIEMECRAFDMDEFDELRRRLFNIIEGAAKATDCDFEITLTEPVYEPLKQDDILARAWNDGMADLGRPIDGTLGNMTASTDMGNVTQRVPGLHPFVGIPGVKAALHTRDFAKASTSPEAFALMYDSALTMAWLILDIAADPARRAEIIRRAEEMRARATSTQ